MDEIPNNSQAVLANDRFQAQSQLALHIGDAYEYCQVICAMEPRQEVIDTINKLGRDRWECFSIFPGQIPSALVDGAGQSQMVASWIFFLKRLISNR